MGPLTATGTALLNTFNYSGRASRGEYWWFSLFYGIALIVCVFLDGAKILTLVQTQGEQALFSLGPFDLATVWASIVAFPTVASLTVRRLRDAGFSAFWFLLIFVPFGAVALMIMHMLPTQGQSASQGFPSLRTSPENAQQPVNLDTHKRAMQGYAVLFDKDKPVTAETQAARKAEMSDYYRSRVLKSAPSA